MTRKEFIKLCGVLGIGLPLQNSLIACGEDDISQSTFQGKVTIIGAGAGGLSAGYLLHQQGIDFEILEASDNYGGRMKINNDFADFPIPLGAEWLETSTDIFQQIVNDSSIQPNIETVADKPDRKFVNYSWFNFFEEYILPSIESKIIYNMIVDSINYSSDQVIITSGNTQFTSDKVIVSVPLKILQEGEINFEPDLPQEKQNAIQQTPIWEGFKAFIEFSEKFYEDEYVFQVNPSSDGEKIYYNAVIGQNTSRNILGLFTVGKPAQDFTSLPEDQIKDFILNELDEIYGKKATPNYVKHLSQNWNKEPFIKSGYVSDHADWRVMKILGNSIANKIYFAGGAYSDGEDWVSVHTAAQSAKRAVESL
ncbi:MAG: flavin monoamine oxidase family protein [Ekhidna sp.]